MKKYQLSESLINEIANYLAVKPYHEVVNLLNSLQKELKENTELVGINKEE